MSKSIHVNSIEILMRLDAALGQFAGKSLDTLEVAGNEIKRRLEWLENCCAARQSEFEYWSAAYDSADSEEDNMGLLAHKRDEAAAKMHQARRAKQRVEESCENFARQARLINRISGENLNDARAFLRQKIQELNDYTGFQPVYDGGSFSSGGSGGAFSAGMKTNNSAGASESQPVIDFTHIRLPKGYQWVRLDEISPKEMSELPAENEFRKISYEDMKRGFGILQRDVLPVLENSLYNARTDYFEDFDRENGREIKTSATEIFQVFFNPAGDKEQIHLTRSKGDKFWTITDGQHRIKVARDLGWSAIPARIVEGSVITKK